MEINVVIYSLRVLKTHQTVNCFVNRFTPNINIYTHKLTVQQPPRELGAIVGTYCTRPSFAWPVVNHFIFFGIWRVRSTIWCHSMSRALGALGVHTLSAHVVHGESRWSRFKGLSHWTHTRAGATAGRPPCIVDDSMAYGCWVSHANGSLCARTCVCVCVCMCVHCMRCVCVCVCVCIRCVLTLVLKMQIFVNDVKAFSLSNWLNVIPWTKTQRQKKHRWDLLYKRWEMWTAYHFFPSCLKCVCLQAHEVI